jgi:hypothetical protein
MVMMKDAFAIGSHCSKETREATTDRFHMRADNNLFAATQPIDLLELVENWVTGNKYDPDDVFVLSFAIEWDTDLRRDCGTNHNEEDEDDWGDPEHMWCGTTGWDRLNYIDEQIAAYEEWLGFSEFDAAVSYARWVVSDIIAEEDAYPGTDFTNIRFGVYRDWAADLCGGAYRMVS